MSQSLPQSGLREPRGATDTTPAYRPRGRQEQVLGSTLYAGRQSSFISSSSGSKPPSLRRVPHFEVDQLPRPRSASANSQNRQQQTVRFVDDQSHFGTNTSNGRSTSASRAADLRRPHPAVRVSRRTATAILYALEEAIRTPNPFTPDLAEENASMSDLAGGSASAAFGRAGDGRARVPTGAASDIPAPASQRMRTPRDVMNERQAREARRQAEAETEARADQQRRIDLERQRSAGRRAAAAAAQARSAGGRPPAVPAYPNPGTASGDVPGSGFAESSASAMRTGGDSSRPTRGPGMQQQPAAAPISYTQQPQTQQRPIQGPPSASQAPRGGGVPQPSSQGQPSGDGGQPRSNTSSFPHAFERWETLSSHWEGLTSYWIRKLEMNTEAIQRENDMSREQMSRQITDLSAAGANLFHAVVELQRLRASSERKFQRWFVDMRDKQVKDDEERQRLHNELDAERQDRADRPTAAIQAELDRRYAEMRRELQISKEEARRAWEELGRREEEERNKQFTLREGHPIFVGGVQVLPMSAISRGPSVQQRPTTREAGYAPQGAPGESEYELQEPSPTDTDPFTSQDTRSAPPPPMQSIPTANIPTYPPGTQPVSMISSSAQPVQTAAPSGFYRQPETFLHDPSLSAPPAPRSAFSEGSEEDPPAPEIDEQGNIRYDTQGRPIPFRPPAASTGGASSSIAVTYPTIPAASTIRTVPQQPPSDPETSDDEYDIAANVAREREQAARYLQQGQAPSQGSPQATQPRTPQEYADYEGEGFGSGTGWEAIPRHQHPTRLSDVLEEEDERSRPSPTRASPGSTGAPRY